MSNIKTLSEKHITIGNIENRHLLSKFFDVLYDPSKKLEIKEWQDKCVYSDNYDALEYLKSNNVKVVKCPKSRTDENTHESLNTTTSSQKISKENTNSNGKEPKKKRIKKRYFSYRKKMWHMTDSMMNNNQVIMKYLAPHADTAFKTSKAGALTTWFSLRRPSKNAETYLNPGKLPVPPATVLSSKLSHTMLNIRSEMVYASPDMFYLSNHNFSLDADSAIFYIFVKELIRYEISMKAIKNVTFYAQPYYLKITLRVGYMSEFAYLCTVLEGATENYMKMATRRSLRDVIYIFTNKPFESKTIMDLKRIIGEDRISYFKNSPECLEQLRFLFHRSPRVVGYLRRYNRVEWQEFFKERYFLYQQEREYLFKQGNEDNENNNNKKSLVEEHDKNNSSFFSNASNLIINKGSNQGQQKPFDHAVSAADLLSNSSVTTPQASFKDNKFNKPTNPTKTSMLESCLNTLDTTTEGGSQLKELLSIPHTTIQTAYIVTDNKTNESFVYTPPASKSLLHKSLTSDLNVGSDVNEAATFAQSKFFKPVRMINSSVQTDPIKNLNSINLLPPKRNSSQMNNDEIIQNCPIPIKLARFHIDSNQQLNLAPFINSTNTINRNNSLPKPRPVSPSTKLMAIPASNYKLDARNNQNRFTKSMSSKQLDKNHNGIHNDESEESVKESLQFLRDPVSKKVMIHNFSTEEDMKHKMAMNNNVSVVLERLNSQEAESYGIVSSKSRKESNSQKMLQYCPGRHLGNIFNRYQYTPSEHQNVQLHGGDLLCLNQGQYINDKIINFYLNYIYSEQMSEDQRQRTYLFNVFFNYKLQGHSAFSCHDPPNLRHARVSKWTKKVDLFDKDYIVIPINESQHWFLAIICFPWMVGMVSYDDLLGRNDSTLNNNGTNKMVSEIPENNTQFATETRYERVAKLKDKYDIEPLPCILLFDSLKGVSRQPNVRIIREYLKSEWDSKRAHFDGPLVFDKNTIRGYNPKVPQQSNNVDCGIYLVHYFEMFFKNPLKTFTKDFFENRLQGWFINSEVSPKREFIQQLILSKADTDSSTDYDEKHEEENGCKQKNEEAAIRSRVAKTMIRQILLEKPSVPSIKSSNTTLKSVNS